MKRSIQAFFTSLIVVLLLFTPQIMLAQGVAWAKFVQGGTASTPIQVNSSVVDNNGDVYVTGKFSNIANFGVTVLTGTGDEGFLAKLNSSGDLIWAETFGSAGNDAGLDVTLDGNGGLYMSGYFASTATFDTITVAPTGVIGFSAVENFLAKYDTSGNVQWVKNGTKRRENNFSGNGSSSIEFKNGYLYYLSYFEYRLSQATNANRTFDGTLMPYPTASSFNSTNVMVVRTDPNGVNSYVESIIAGPTASTEFVISDDVGVKSNGNMIIQGRARSGLVIGTSTIPYTGTGQFMFLIELDTAGAYEDSYLMPNIGFFSSRSYGIATDAQDNIFLLNFRSNSGVSSIPNGQLLPPTGTTLMKFNSALVPQNLNVLSTDNSFITSVTSLDVSTDGNVVVGGVLNGVFTMAGSSFSLARKNFIASCDTSFSTFNWVSHATSSNSTSFSNAKMVSSVSYSGTNEVIATGYIDESSTLFGDYSSGNASTNDGYIIKVVDCMPQSVSISPLNPAICGGGSNVVLNGSFGPGLSANWLSAGAKVNGATNSSFFVNNPGTYALEIDSLGCKDTSNVVTVTVSALPTVTAPSNSLSICSNAGQVVIPPGSPVGGVWSGAGVINDTVFDPALTGSGPSLITYTYTSPAGCSASAVQIANVITPPTLQLTGTLPSFCENDPNYGLGSIVFPVGGTYSGSGVTGSSFDPSAAGVGTHIIKYIYSAGIGCIDSISFNLVVNPSPTISFPSLNPICQTVFSTPLNLAIPTGGTYSGNFIISNNFYPFLSGPGTYPITYSVTQNGCSSSSTQSIRVDAPVVTSLSSISPFCLDDTIYTLTEGTPSGGVYLINGVADSVINPSAVGVGTHELKYAYTNACGTDTSTVNFVINGLPVVNLNATGPYCENEATVTLNQGTPAGGVYSGSVVNSGNFDPAVAGVGTSTIYYTYTDANSCINMDSTTVTVEAKPTPVLSVDSLLCVDNGLANLNASIAGGTWSGTGVSGNSFDPATAGLGLHVVTYTVTNAAGCSDTSSTTIEVKGLPTVSLGAFAPICNSSSSAIPLTGGLPLGGVYSGLGVSNGLFNPGVSGAGFHLVTYTYSDTFGCSMFDTATMTVDTSTVTLSLNPFNNVCVDASPVALSGGLPAGGVFSGTGVLAGNFDPSVAGTGTSLIYYSYTAPNACIATISQTIEVDTLPAVQFDVLPELCVDASTITLNTGSPAGGVYSGPGVVAGMFDPVVSGAGTHVLTYLYTDGNGCSNSVTQSILVNPLPTVSLASFAGICYDSGTVVLSGGQPTGGVYTGNGVVNGVFDPVLAGSGSHVITYSITDTNGCNNSAVASISVFQPVATLAAFSDVCIDAAPLTLAGGTPIGGVYAGTGVTNGQFDASAAGSGAFDITYTIVENGCTAIDTQSIVVNSLPNVVMTGFFDVCESDTAYPLNAGFPAGGIYTGTGVTNINFNGSTAGVGFHTITYTFTDTSGCVNSAIDSIRVNANPVLSLAPFSAVCENVPAFTLSGGLPVTGTYSGTGVLNGMFDPSIAGPGTHVIEFADTNAFGCSSSMSDTLVVHAIPQVSLATFADLCIDASPLTLTGGLPTGGTYSGTGVAGGVFDPVVSGSGTFDIVYEFTNANQCVVSDTQQITVNDLPVVTFAPVTDLCVNDTAITLTGGAPASGTYSGTGVSNGSFDPAIAGTGSHVITYSYSDANGCTSDATITIVVNGLPTVVLPAINAVCENASLISLTNGTPTGGVYTGTGVTGSNFDPFLSGVGSHLVTYTYTDANGCISEDTASVNVNALPMVMNPVQDTLCVNEPAIVLTGATPIGGVFTGSGVSSGSFDPSISGSGMIDVIYTFTDNFGCVGADTGMITVSDLPTIDAGNDESICEGSSITLLATGGDVYQWSTGSVNDTTNITPTQDMMYAVIGANLFGCVASDSVFVTVNANPTVNLANIDSLCMDSVITIDAGATFSSYAWSTGESSFSIQVGPYVSTQTVSIDLVVTDSNGCIASDTVTFDVVDCMPTGIKDFENDLTIQLNPNPNNGIFTLEIKDWKSTEATIRIISGTGSIVREQVLGSNGGLVNHTFDMSNLANGLYWMVIEGDQALYRKQIMINK